MSILSAVVETDSNTFHSTQSRAIGSPNPKPQFSPNLSTDMSSYLTTIQFSLIPTNRTAIRMSRCPSFRYTKFRSH